MTADAVTGPELGSELPSACPSCGATVRTAVPWCLQCYAPLRPTSSQPQPAPEEPPAAVEQPLAEPAQPSVPGAQDARSPAADVERLTDQLFAELATSSKVLPSWWSRLPTTSTGRTLWVAGAIAGAGLALVLVMTVLGLLL